MSGKTERDRKAEHISLALDERMQLSGHFFDRYTFDHLALPEIDMADIDLSTPFLGHTLEAPLLISCMTGGTGEASRQGRDWAELPIMMESNRIWRGLAAQTGEADLAFTQSASIYLAEDSASLAKYQQWHALAKQHQLDTAMLSRDQIEARLPGAKGDWVGGMITATDGRAEPLVAVPALARAARRAGALVAENCAVRTLDLEAGRVAGVVTEKGRVRCRGVLLAAGVWSTHFAANAGVALPQLTVRSTAARTEPAPAHFENNIAAPDLALRRRDDGGYTVAPGDLAEHYLSPGSFKYFTKFLKIMKLSAKDLRLHWRAPAGYPGAWGSPRRWSGETVSPFELMRVLDPAPSPLALRRIRERLPRRFPALKDVALAQAWAGMIDVTPDAVPLLGESAEIGGLFLATGLSGHGFGIGPGVGRVMADLIAGRNPGHDLTRFRPSRFSDGSKIVPGPY